MVMIARRFIASLMLLMLVSNILVYASSSSENGVKNTGQAFTVVSLKHESAGAMTRILIESNAPPLYTISRPTEKLLVIDLPGGESAQLTPLYTVKSSAVDSIAIRKSHFGSASSANPSRVVGSSIEIALQGNVRDTSKLKGNTLIIELVSEQAAAPVASSLKPGVYVEPVAVEGNSNVVPTAVKAKAEAKAAAPTSAEMRVANRPEPEKAPLAASNLKAATVIREVRSELGEGAARIVVDTDGTAAYKNFSLESPYRIVVDVSGVRSQVGNKTLSVGAAGVDKVRVGQPGANVVRIVVEAKPQTPYRVDREGASLVITVGNLSAAKPENSNSKSVAQLTKGQTELPALDAKSENAEVKVAGQRIDKQSVPAVNPVPSQSAKTGVTNSPKAANDKPGASASTSAPATNKPSVTVTAPTQAAKSAVAENTVAQANKVAPNKAVAESRPRVSNPSNSGTPAVTQPQRPPVREQISQPVTPTPSVRNAMDVQRPSPSQPTTPTQAVVKGRTDQALCDPSYVGGPISFDLRSGVDIRDMLRFVSQQYGINFIFDKSVSAVPVDIRVNDLPWNYVLDSVLRANRLGIICKNGIVRIASLQAIQEEETAEVAIAAAKVTLVPLVTKIIHLKYARATGALGGEGSGAGSRNSGGASASSGTGQGGLLQIAQKRLSARGSIELDSRTNSLIITDLPEFLVAVEDILNKLDKPEPQVEIEARIVIASRNFLRDIGVELAAGAAGRDGKVGVFQTSPVQFSPGSGVAASSGSGSGGGGAGSGTGGSGSGSGTGTGGTTVPSLGPNLIGPFATGSFAAVAGSVLSLTTGIFGTSVISAALTLNETKGQIRTIASPRITTTDNKTAEIVNGVQIPVQTVSNNTITTTFITAALRLQITPQIIEENGEVLMKVVAENNTVNTALANSFNGGTPGINTQSAESTVRVPDGGTTVMGGINIDNEGHSINRTPGVSRIPVIGELFKRRSTSRNFDEILFFITPRIIRNDNIVKPTGLAPLDGRVTPDTPPAKPSPKKN